MTPDSLGGANALEELAGWISDRMDEAQAEAAYSPRLDHDGPHVSAGPLRHAKADAPICQGFVGQGQGEQP